MTELRLESVSKRYGGGRGASETVALRNVDLAVRDGEFFTLVGPSGCGKTTTLRTIAGFEEPTAGDVRFDGAEVTGVAPEDRNVGVVFQSYALFPHMTVAENVGYGLRFREPPTGTTADERVAELLDLVDLDGMGDRSPDQLSGGQQQRVALARALAPQPELLLLDEPMSALDARLRESLRRQVTRIQTELGITTVYVTHDQEEALAISDRVAVMNDGRVEQVATPQDIYREPATRFVAEFVGDNNVFDGDVRDRGDDAAAIGGDGDRSAVEVSGEYSVVEVSGKTFELPALPGRADRVTFCVRPGALSRAADRNRITIAVETCEFLGETVRVNGLWNGTETVLQLPDVPDGDAVTVGFDPDDAHVVDVR
ncbi:ABC transporter ATP-binding protein [Halosolutus gelatinilyticus]|uniref:ABC transporter ATP-binding protein n=1 Tax=Halosolutus gelatinilyticus TaxID=2931975 RepID=UPI001FF52D35|nr:ABC transporter ATP-binding protein [Halosolutus gelatinilyticus]